MPFPYKCTRRLLSGCQGCTYLSLEDVNTVTIDRCNASLDQLKDMSTNNEWYSHQSTCHECAEYPNAECQCSTCDNNDWACNKEPNPNHDCKACEYAINDAEELPCCFCFHLNDMKCQFKLRVPAPVLKPSKWEVNWSKSSNDLKHCIEFDTRVEAESFEQAIHYMGGCAVINEVKQ